MARFLIKASYSVEGTKGLLKEGGTGRRNAVKHALEALGGSLETIYFAYGEDDAFIIADVPDSVSGVALSLAANATGTVKVTTIPLITVAEMDAACKKTVAFRPAGAAGAGV